MQMTSRSVLEKRWASARDEAVWVDVGRSGGMAEECGEGSGIVCGGLSEDVRAGVAGGAGRVDAFGLVAQSGVWWW